MGRDRLIRQKTVRSEGRERLGANGQLDALAFPGVIGRIFPRPAVTR